MHSQSATLQNQQAVLIVEVKPSPCRRWHGRRRSVDHDSLAARKPETAAAGRSMFICDQVAGGHLLVEACGSQLFRSTSPARLPKMIVPTRSDSSIPLLAATSYLGEHGDRQVILKAAACPRWNPRCRSDEPDSAKP